MTASKVAAFSINRLKINHVATIEATDDIAMTISSVIVMQGLRP